MSDTDPRCPYCDEPASGKWGVLYGDGTPGDDVQVYEIHCTNKGCCAAGCLVQQITKADCVRQATTMKLLDRKVREAVDAERERLITLIGQHSNSTGEILHEIKLLEAIRARKESSRRQDVDKSGDGHE